MAALMPKGCQKRENLNIFNIELTLPKLYTRVRFPPPAPTNLRPFLALDAPPNCRRARPQRSLPCRNDCAYMEHTEAGCCARSRLDPNRRHKGGEPWGSLVVA